jgi:hypothetical protein
MALADTRGMRCSLGLVSVVSCSIALISACGDAGRADASSAADELDTDATLDGSGEQTDQDGSGDQTDQTDQPDSSDQTDSSEDDADTGIKFDTIEVPDQGDPPVVDECKVTDDMNAIGMCRQQAPPDAFEPDIQWTFTDLVEPYSYVTPLVANFTDRPERRDRSLRHPRRRAGRRHQPRLSRLDRSHLPALRRHRQPAPALRHAGRRHLHAGDR